MADPLTPRGGFRHRFFARMKSLRSLRRRDSDETSNGFGQTPGIGFRTSSITRASTAAPADAGHSSALTRIRDSNDRNKSDSPDIWSAAFHEAVKSLGDDIDTAILKGNNTAQLFERLEEIGKDAAQESIFIRGVAYLRSIQVPLEQFKLALDLATPLSKLEPTAATVFGVLSSVTAIAISLATADLEFAKQIGEMLKQISYIDGCDTLGQRNNHDDIHKTLVSVYREILEFYKVAHEILTRRGVKLVMKMILEANRLPEIVTQIVSNADNLERLVSRATWEITQDIQSMLYDSQIARWLGSDKLSLQYQHHLGLSQARNDNACSFLVEDPAFKRWYHASDSQWLLLLGDIGCGKSVTISYAVDELSRRHKTKIPQPKTCYYYCQDGQTGQSAHMFASLILALLEQLSGLKKLFYAWYKGSQSLNPATSPTELGEFLAMALGALDRPLFIVVDGLDECSRATRNTLFDLLKALLKSNLGIKVMLASRPEEGILQQLDTVDKIRVKSDTSRDALIVQTIVDTRLSYLTKEVKDLVIEALTPLAKGSAIWVKMVVELIEVRQIRAPGSMRVFLAEQTALPERLSTLYATLILRLSSNDDENKAIINAALWILSSAKRPLSIQELAWGVTLAATPADIKTITNLAELVDSARVITLIYPLVTGIDHADLKKRNIRLAHQSVKAFVDREWTRQQRLPKKSEWSVIDEPVESLEHYILDVCLDYLLLEEIGSITLFSDEQEALNELPPEADIFGEMDASDYDPHCTWETWEEGMIRYDPNERGFGQFFAYAASHWLDHLKTGTAQHLNKVKNLCHAGSIRMDNWIKQNCRPDCAVIARFDFDSRLYDPLSIVALYGSDAMLCNLVEVAFFGEAQFLPHSALNAADQILRWGDPSRLKVIFSGFKLNERLRNLEFFGLVIDRWFEPCVRRPQWDVAFELVELVTDSLARDQWGYELLCLAAGAGCMPIIQPLLVWAHHKPEHRAELLRGSQPIGEALLGNYTDVVEYLLEQEGFEAYVKHVNSHGETLLHLASKTCNPRMFQLLIPRLSQRVHQMDKHGDTALVCIIKNDIDSAARYESARILLASQNEVDWHVELRDKQCDPLQVAVGLGDTEMCRLLVYEGRMSPYSALKVDSQGQFILNHRAQKNHKDILKLLKACAEHN